MKQHSKIFFILMLSSICCTMLFAQDSIKQYVIDKQLQECLDSGKNYTTSGMIECTIRARDAWDKELNKYYKLLMQISTEEEKEKLKTAQKNWLIFRDAEKVFSATMYNNMKGTMWEITKVQVDSDLIKQRAIELKAYYDDKTLK